MNSRRTAVSLPKERKPLARRAGDVTTGDVAATNPATLIAGVAEALGYASATALLTLFEQVMPGPNVFPREGLQAEERLRATLLTYGYTEPNADTIVWDISHTEAVALDRIIGSLVRLADQLAHGSPPLKAAS